MRGHKNKDVFQSGGLGVGRNCNLGGIGFMKNIMDGALYFNSAVSPGLYRYSFTAPLFRSWSKLFTKRLYRTLLAYSFRIQLSAICISYFIFSFEPHAPP